MSIQVNEFYHVEGQNDAEYIELLKKELEAQRKLTSRAIDKLRQPKQEWIPVSERLPSKDGYYLATLQHKYPDKEYKTVETEEFRNSKFYENMYITVIAWMPLPEAYHSGEATEMVEQQTDDGTAFIKRHGLRVDYGDEVPYDLKPFID